VLKILVLRVALLKGGEIFEMWRLVGGLCVIGDVCSSLFLSVLLTLDEVSSFATCPKHVLPHYRTKSNDMGW
jgi:hypothetical protein